MDYRVYRADIRFWMIVILLSCAVGGSGSGDDKSAAASCAGADQSLRRGAAKETYLKRHY